MTDTTGPDRADLLTIAVEGYVYLFPLLVMDATRRQMTSGDLEGHGPLNTLVHVRSYPPAGFREVVRPNFDTLYSVAWIDVHDEPVVVHAPPLADRFFMLPLYDMWSEAFACPGSRTTGGDGVTFAVCRPGWSGDLPAGVLRIDAPTPFVWMIGRTQTNGPADYERIHAFQDSMSLMPLSAWPGPAPAPSPAPPADTTTGGGEPPKEVLALSGAEFFARAADLLCDSPPHLTDFSQLARLAPLGFAAGEPFDASTQSAAVQEAIAAAPGGAVQLLLGRLAGGKFTRNGWMMLDDGVGVFGNAYTRRAAVAWFGLGANPPEDAIYPILQVDADGEPLDGANDYVLHFDAGQLPPAEAFWSVTMYDAEGYVVANELDRFALGDRDELVLNADGSLDLWLAHERPGDDKVANWLPAPRGPLGVTMRIYEPGPALFSGSWSPPPVRKVG